VHAHHEVQTDDPSEGLPDVVGDEAGHVDHVDRDRRAAETGSRQSFEPVGERRPHVIDELPIWTKGDQRGGVRLGEHRVDAIVHVGVELFQLDAWLLAHAGKQRAERVPAEHGVAVLVAADRRLRDTGALGELALSEQQALAFAPQDFSRVVHPPMLVSAHAPAAGGSAACGRPALRREGGASGL